MLFSPEDIKKIRQYKFQFLDVEIQENILVISLNRPKKKNALHPVMINELAFSIQYAHEENTIRAVVIKAYGDVFCAGADLNAFQKKDAEIITSTVPQAKSEILFNEFFHHLYKPSFVLVEGNVYAGGMLFITACTYVIAKPEAKFGLPEVKRGLFPFQVMGALLDFVPERKVIDWCIMGKEITAKEALQLGVITHIHKVPSLLVEQLLFSLFENSPHAIYSGMESYKNLKEKNIQEKNIYLSEMLLKTLSSEDAQEGIRAFSEREKPIWKKL